MVYLLIVLSVLLHASLSLSATIYMGADEDYTNLVAAAAAMSGGDTLIIRDGTYTGASNLLTEGSMPPAGNYGADTTDRTTDDVYTIIKAENDGLAIFPEGMVKMAGPVSGTLEYLRFEGFRIKQGFSLSTVFNIQILRCSFEDSKDGVDNSSTFYLTDSDYILVEDCWAFGSGRYKFQARNGQYIVFRRCVVRYDRSDTTLNIGAFCSYSSDNIAYQNCIVIDSDTDEFWFYAEGEMYGAFGIPHAGQDIYVDGCIALNVKMQLARGQVTSTDYHMRNTVGWDLYGGSRIHSYAVTYSHLTVKLVSYGSDYAELGYGSGVYGYLASPAVSNSIIQGASISALRSTVSDYNALYDNTSNYVSTTAGSNDWSSENGTELPSFTTYLDYILYNEDSDRDVGADIIYKYGSSGTYYGQAGWDSLTTDALWPFPNEARIKLEMAAYSYTGDMVGGGSGTISGGRGFAAQDETLTDYIWEYAGSERPADLYDTPLWSGNYY